MKIYVVSSRITNLPEGVEYLSVKDSLALIRGWPVVQFDTETSGLNPHIKDLISLQFGYKDFTTGEVTSIVVDCKEYSPKEYKSVLESSYLIGHNIKFDLEFLYKYEIVPTRVYDTMICEQVLYLGFKKNVRYSLGVVAHRYLQIDLDKSYQSKIAYNGLTAQGILYAANDVVYLQDIRKAQIAKAKSRKCLNAFSLENRAIPAIAYAEWCGIHLDENKWSAKMKDDMKEYNASKEALEDYIRSHPVLGPKYTVPVKQLSLWEPISENKPQVTVRWGSSDMHQFFKDAGFNIYDKTGAVSVAEDNLSIQKGIDDMLLKLYFDFSGNRKLITTYGQIFINLINPNTDRIHTQFKQLGTVTGRMSSGGGLGKEDAELAFLKGLKPSQVRFINLQNIPARGDRGVVTRACFTAKQGNDFISCDFSAEESRVQADVWNEKKLLDAFENGIDTHNLYAKLCFEEELKDVDVRDVKKLYPELRQAAKSAEFAIGYGSDGSAIAEHIGMPIEKARAMVQGILKGMPGMAKFKKDAAHFVAKHGYIVLHQLTGHRIYWPEWSSWRAEEDSMDRDFWQDFNTFHKGTGDAICKKVAKHKNKSHDWFEKNVLNYPIQGGSAIVMKQAVADFFQWICKHNLFEKVLICGFVHDEIVCECPKALTQYVAKVLPKIMEKAAAKFYKKLPIPAEASVGDHWIH